MDIIMTLTMETNQNVRFRSIQRPHRRDDPPALNQRITPPSLPLPPRPTIPNNNSPSRILPVPQAAPYKLGQKAHDHDIVRFKSISEAHEILPNLPIGTPLFVKRSNRDWTYARIVSYRRLDSVEGGGCDMGYYGDFWSEGKDNFIVVALDEDYSMRKFIQKAKWHSCVRLVRLATRREEHNGRYSVSLLSFR